MSVAVPTLETERLILRGWTERDIAPFIALCADEPSMRFVGGIMDATAAFRRMAAYAGSFLIKGYGTYALEDKASGALVGYCGVFDPPGWPEREINWGTVPAHRGKGFVTEAAARVRDHAYDILKFPSIASCIDLENTASIAVARRLGATLHRTVDFRGRAMGVFRHVEPAARSKQPKT